LIEAAIFDLGGTLIEYAGEHTTWPDLEITGMKTIYFPSSQRFAPPNGIQPDATISGLKDLPGCLVKLSESPHQVFQATHHR
jgi:FMN phosphatase YigB (HAD superfamily)